jgi:hypothetical protein
MPGKVTVDPNAGGEEVPKQSTLVFAPIAGPEFDLALVYGDRELYVGLDQETTLEVFEPLEKSIQFSSLPPHLDERSFGAFGWEQNGFAFGGITYRDPDAIRATPLVVLAMYTRDDATEEVVQATVQDYRLRYGEPTKEMPGTRIAYWFWERPGRRLMVNTSVSPGGNKSLTVAVGGTQAMTLLGMSSEQATADKSLAIQRLNAQQSAP